MGIYNVLGSDENGKSPLRYQLNVAAGKVGTSTSQLLKMYGPECKLIGYDVSTSRHFVYAHDIDALREFVKARAPGPVTIVAESNVDFLGMGQLAQRMHINPLVLSEVKRRGMWPDSVTRPRLGRGPTTLLYPATITDALWAVINKHELNKPKPSAPAVAKPRVPKQFNTPDGFLTFAEAAKRMNMHESTLKSRWSLKMKCWPKEVEVRTDTYPHCVHESIVQKMSPALVVPSSRKQNRGPVPTVEPTRPLTLKVVSKTDVPFSMSDIAAQLIQDGHTAMGIYLIKYHVTL